jgi:hypothetical protein
MKFSFKRFDTARLRRARLMATETAILRALPDHIRRDIGLPECGSVGRDLSRHRFSSISW